MLSSPTIDTDSQIGLLMGLPLARMVYENFVKDWSSSLSSYSDSCLEGASLLLSNNRVEGHYPSDIICSRVEKSASLHPSTGFGVARYVQRRLKSLSRLYDRIFNAYARVILKQAKSQAISEDHSLDCFQNGSLGLLRAISSYDHVSNARFAGHARWWIRQSMLYSIKEDSNLIRVSSNTWQHYAKLESLRIKHELKSGTATLDDLSSQSGYSTSHIESIYNTVRTSQVKSLDHPLREDGSSTLLSVIESDSAKKVDTTNYAPSDSVKFLLSQLPTDTRNLVCLSYGLTEYVIQDIPDNLVSSESLRQKKTVA